MKNAQYLCSLKIKANIYNNKNITIIFAKVQPKKIITQLYIIYNTYIFIET